MGNYHAGSASRAREERAAFATYILERDTKFPAMDRPCGTPGAIYSLVVEGNVLAVSVTLPFAVSDAVPQEAVETMKKALHDAILPLVEQFYRDVWNDTIAGKVIDDTGLMPKKWGLLFTKWIRRCWQRGATPEGIKPQNRWQPQNWYQLPDEYQWENPSRADTEGWQR